MKRTRKDNKSSLKKGFPSGSFVRTITLNPKFFVRSILLYVRPLKVRKCLFIKPFYLSKKTSVTTRISWYKMGFNYFDPRCSVFHKFTSFQFFMFYRFIHMEMDLANSNIFPVHFIFFQIWKSSRVSYHLAIYRRPKTFIFA